MTRFHRSGQMWASAGLLIALALGGVSCGGGGGAGGDCVTCPPPGGGQTLARIVITPATATIMAGQTASFAVQGQDAAGGSMSLSGQTVNWGTSDSLTATVAAGGTARGLKPGTATLFASVGTIQGAATLTIIPVPVAVVTISAPSTSMTVGSSMTLTATTQDAGGTPLAGRAVSWSSGAPSVAGVDATTGVVTAVAPGTASITATSEGKSGSIALTITPVPVATVSVSPPTLSLIVGQSASLAATTKDAAGAALTGRPVAWSSDTPGVATVNAGTGAVTAVAPGKATITASSEGKSGTAAVTVALPPVATVTISIDSSSLDVGHSAHAAAVLKDASGAVLTGRAVSWSSATPAVATVDASTAVITAVGVGTVQIIATSEGKSGSASLTVTAPVPVSVKLSGVPSPLSIDDNGTATVTATVVDQRGQAFTTLPANYALVWSSSAPASATVTAGGTGLSAVIAGQRGGRAMARVSLTRISPAATLATDSVTVNVQQVPASITLASAVADTGVVGSTLPALVFQVKDRFGGADSGATVGFASTIPGGQAGVLPVTQAITDASGQVRAAWTLSTLAGTNAFVARIPARPTIAALTVSTYGKAGAPAAITVSQGDGLVGATGAELLTPAIVQIKDQFGNPTPRVAVTWQHYDVDGTMVGAQQLSATDDNGSAPPYIWDLTSHGGRQTVRVQAGSVSTAISATALVPAKILLCSGADIATCIPDSGSLGWPSSGGYTSTVQVFDAQNTPIPDVPFDIYAPGMSTSSIGAPSLMLASAEEVTRTHGPSADERPIPDLFAVAQPLMFTMYSGRVIDIRGGSAGVSSITLVSAPPVTPQVISLYHVTVSPVDPSPNCAWALTVVNAPATYPTLKVGEVARLRFDPVNCGGSNFLGFGNVDLTWTTTAASPTPATLLMPFGQSPPSVLVDITADHPGSMPLSFHMFFVKIGPRNFDQWTGNQDFPSVPIVVVP